MALKNVIYLKKEDYKTLKDTGTVTVNGRTEPYNPDNLHCVPDETEEQIADLQAEQAVQGAKITNVEASVKKYYRHKIHIDAYYDDGHSYQIRFNHVSSRSTAYTFLDLYEDALKNSNGKFVVGVVSTNYGDVQAGLIAIQDEGTFTIVFNDDAYGMSTPSENFSILEYTPTEL